MDRIAEYIVRMQPYTNGLKRKILSDDMFSEALKINNPKRFISAGAIVISYSPLMPQDRIIGFFVYDRKMKIFKQDFIVDVGGKEINYILYTKIRDGRQSKSVKDISQFFSRYGKDIYYTGSHHPSFEEIPDEIKPSALRAIKLAEKLDITGLRTMSDEELNNFNQELIKIGL